jgi:copper chaperone CopZ
MIKKIFKIKGMHCTGCTLEIDDDLEEAEGIEEANTHYAKAQTEVKFDPQKISEEKIVKLIKKTGYDAIPVVD